MNIKATVVTLAAIIALQGAVAPSHADEALVEGVTKLTTHTLTLPFRLVGGGLTGTYGFVSGGLKGTYDTIIEVNDVVVEGGSTPAQLIVAPIAAPFGFIKGAVNGFAEEFPTGYNLWEKEEGGDE